MIDDLRTDLAHAQIALANLCEDIGLAEHAKHLRSAFCQDCLSECRSRCAIIVHNAGLIHAVVTHERNRQPAADVDVVLGTLASRALDLESLAAKVIVLCDRAVQERDDLAKASKDQRPILNTSRHMNLSRGTGTDR